MDNEGFELVESNNGFFPDPDSVDSGKQAADMAATSDMHKDAGDKECDTVKPESDATDTPKQLLVTDIDPLPAIPAILPEATKTLEADCNAFDGNVDLREEWTQSECHMQDIRYAEQPKPELPPSKIKRQLKVLVVGQAETGKSLLIRNLFASYTRDDKWTPTDVSGLTQADFVANPSKFQTVINGVEDANAANELTYIIQEAPPLEGSPEVCAAMLLSYIEAQQEDFVKQEQDLSLKRSLVRDGRVDVCLYTLPTNRRYSAFDLAIIRVLGTIVPTIPVMCKADCMTDEEMAARRLEMEKLVQEGLPIFQFPEHVARSSASKQTSPPFIVMAGNESDESVHPFWFVRKYRWGTCESYREIDSDMKQLRQMMLESGFFALKEAADEKFRCQVGEAREDGAKSSHAVEAVGSGDSSNTAVAPPTLPLQRAIMQDSKSGSDAPPAEQGDNGWLKTQDNATLEELKGVAGIDAATDVGSDLDDAPGLAFVKSDYYKVDIKGVLRTSSGSNFRLTLHIPAIDKVLCMRIGSMEGSNLTNLSDNVPNSRPSTYDTWKAMMDMTGSRMVRAVITHCADTVFFGRIHCVARGGEVLDVDARPSDAFNMALRCGAPIWLSKEVADTFAKHPSKHVWPLGERRTV